MSNHDFEEFRSVWESVAPLVAAHLAANPHEDMPQPPTVGLVDETSSTAQRLTKLLYLRAYVRRDCPPPNRSGRVPTTAMAGSEFRDRLRTCDAGSPTPVEAQRVILGQQTDFYHTAYRPSLLDTSSGHARIYLHATRDSAESLVAGLTSSLIRRKIAYRLKIVANTAAYGRSDACVLLVARHHVRLVAWSLHELERDVLDKLAQSVPLFTKGVLSGVSIADQPPGGVSFGYHRCRLWAESVLECNRRGDLSAPSVWNAMFDTYARHGLDLRRPHLNAGSVEMDWPSRDCHADRRRVSDVVVQPVVHSSVDIASTTDSEIGQSKLSLERLDGLANLIVRDAVWNDDQCCWIAATENDATMCGPDWLDGSAGISACLARAFTFTNDRLHLRTALAGLNHSVSRMDGFRAGDFARLSSGPIGVLHAVVQARRYLPRDRTLDALYSRAIRNVAKSGHRWLAEREHTPDWDELSPTLESLIQHDCLTLKRITQALCEDICNRASHLTDLPTAPDRGNTADPESSALELAGSVAAAADFVHASRARRFAVSLFERVTFGNWHPKTPRQCLAWLRCGRAFGGSAASTVVREALERFRTFHPGPTASFESRLPWAEYLAALARYEDGRVAITTAHSLLQGAWPISEPPPSYRLRDGLSRWAWLYAELLASA